MAEHRLAELRSFQATVNCIVERHSGIFTQAKRADMPLMAGIFGLAVGQEFASPCFQTEFRFFIIFFPGKPAFVPMDEIVNFRRWDTFPEFAHGARRYRIVAKTPGQAVCGVPDHFPENVIMCHGSRAKRLMGIEISRQGIRNMPKAVNGMIKNRRLDMLGFYRTVDVVFEISRFDRCIRGIWDNRFLRFFGVIEGVIGIIRLIRLIGVVKKIFVGDVHGVPP